MASEILLSLGDIKGESKVPKHLEEINIESWSWGVSNPASTVSLQDAGGSGKANFGEISIAHKIDKASPNIFKACVTGKVFKEVKITSFRQVAEQAQEFQILTLYKASITSTSTASQVGTSESFENFSLVFLAFDMEYKADKGGINFTWNIPANKDNITEYKK